MNTVYRLWRKEGDVCSDPAEWSGAWDAKFLDRQSAQKYCNKANHYMGWDLYEVAKDNGDNGPSFFDVNDPEPVSAIAPSSESDCWPPFSNPQPDTYADEPCPDTERSSEAEPPCAPWNDDAIPMLKKAFDAAFPIVDPPSPDAKRFVTMEDLRATFKVEFNACWTIGPTTIEVRYGKIALNGNLLTAEEARKIWEALDLAIQSTAA